MPPSFVGRLCLFLPEKGGVDLGRRIHGEVLSRQRAAYGGPIVVTLSQQFGGFCPEGSHSIKPYGEIDVLRHRMNFGTRRPSGRTGEGLCGPWLLRE
jgi:hypothetical protein